MTARGCRHDGAPSVAAPVMSVPSYCGCAAHGAFGMSSQSQAHGSRTRGSTALHRVIPGDLHPPTTAFITGSSLKPYAPEVIDREYVRAIVGALARN